MYEETYPWPIKCHICLNEFAVEVGRMKAKKALRCPDCGVRLECRRSELVLELCSCPPHRHSTYALRALAWSASSGPFIA
jgi:DNA-directed RNA polymerase subunit RPC12/RpoP